MNRTHVEQVKRRSIARRCALAVFAVSLAGSAQAQTAANTRTSLPDWSGIWQMVGNTVFDHASVQPPNGRAGEPGVREFPPYNDEWEAIYKKNIELVKQGKCPDPVSTCGTPHGFPRIMNVPDVYEFAVTPAATYILAENGPGVLRVYTDGRKHPGADERWPTYTGASIGRWEGDTLVFETISVKGSGDNDAIVDRTGLVLSNESRATTRMRKINDTTIEAQMTIEDPKALKGPWRVTKQYRKQAAGTWAWDYACAENNRNPISGSGKTLTLGPDGKPIDKKID
jgi:hypothetical protein